jgi:hypothetical protein
MNVPALVVRSLPTTSSSGRGPDRRSSDAGEASASAPAPLLPAQAVSAATPTQPSLLPARLVIELDAVAERFVQTLVDGAGETVLRRYPDEAQLAFSRGVNAYLAALARR